jgi:hypothetical protein
MSITNESSLLCYFDDDTVCFFTSMKSLIERYHKANAELHMPPNPTSEVTVIIREVLNFPQIFPESIEAYVLDIVMFCCSKRNTRATKPTIKELRFRGSFSLYKEQTSTTRHIII